jgi:hypothetical protein
MELDEEFWNFCSDSHSARELEKNIGYQLSEVTLKRWAHSKTPLPEEYRDLIGRSLKDLKRRIESEQAVCVAHLNQLMNRFADEEKLIMDRFNSFLDGFKTLTIMERSALSAYVREVIQDMRKNLG